jgi:hypothetical protein
MKALLQVLLLLAATIAAHAQGTFEAIVNYSSGSAAGPTTLTEGWAFSPSDNIIVTKLGCLSSIIAETPSVSVGLWNWKGDLLASNTITSGSFLSNTTYYASVSPVGLAAGSTYYVGAFAVGGFTVSIIGPDLGGFATFSSGINTNSIAYAESTSSTRLAWPTSPADSAGYLALGPNFYYDKTPEPSALSLLAFSGLVFLARRRLK